MIMPVLRKVVGAIFTFIAVISVWHGQSLDRAPLDESTYNKSFGTKNSKPKDANTSSPPGKTDRNPSHDLGLGVSDSNDDNFDNQALEQIHLYHELQDGNFNHADGTLENEMNAPKRFDGFTRAKDEEGDSDPSVRRNSDLIRHRPRNLRLVFIGDSLTRYQYLSLAYFLRYGRWFDPSIYPNNLVYAHSFHHSFHPNDDWNEFLIQTNRMLQPNELCDCNRQEMAQIAIERRYFQDDDRNNIMVYINVNGETTAGHKGFYGRVDPRHVFSDKTNEERFRSGLLPLNETEYEWEHRSWAELIRQHVGPLNLGPTAVAILNAGIHPHRFHDSVRSVSLKVALEDVSMKGIWKTTTFSRDEVLSMNNASAATDDFHPQLNKIDREMCDLMDDCFDLRWLADVNPDLYHDDLHFMEPVYRILNEDLLAKLNMLPVNYQTLNRSIILRKK